MRIWLAAMLAAITTAVLPLNAWCESSTPAMQARSGATTPPSDGPPITALERWVWEQVRQGNEIRLPGECPDRRTQAGQSDNESDLSRYTLSGPFVAMLLSAAAPSIRIHGARIAGDVVIEGAVTSGPVTISCSTIEGSVRFQDWQALEGMELSRVLVDGSLTFHDIRARSLVAVTESIIDRVEILRSRFSSDLSLRAMQGPTELKIASTRIDGSLLMGCHVSSPESCGDATYGQTKFLGVRVSNSLDLIGSHFSDNVSFEELIVGGSLLARRVQCLKGLTVRGGNIVGEFQMFDSTVQGLLELNATMIQGGVDLRDSTLAQVSIHRADIDRYIDLGASRLRSLNLEGTLVRGELRMVEAQAPVDWGSPDDDVRFNARNTRVESLLDVTGSWPGWLRRELDGFEYDRLSGFSDSGLSAYLRGADWFKGWLAGDGTYSPQPYRHLHELLRREGQREAANEIAYAAKERERTALPLLDGDRLWLEFLCRSIGYGIGLKPFRVVWWMLALGLLGWFVAIWATRNRGVTVWPSLWYSISFTIPGLADMKDDDVSVLLSRRARRWFSLQRLLCFALASFAVTAAVGIVQP